MHRLALLPGFVQLPVRVGAKTPLLPSFVGGDKTPAEQANIEVRMPQRGAQSAAAPAPSASLFAALIQALGEITPNAAGGLPAASPSALPVSTNTPVTTAVPFSLPFTAARPSTHLPLPAAATAENAEPTQPKRSVRRASADPQKAESAGVLKQLAVPAFTPASVLPPPLAAKTASAPPAPEKTETPATPPVEHLRVDAAPVAVEVRIRPATPEPVLKAAVAAAAVTPVVHSAPVALPHAAPVVTEVTVAPPKELPKETTAPGRLDRVPEPPPAPPNPAPLRAVALEFTPDGARDVKVRVSERGGEVHIAVHSTDAALTGVLKEGVHDLAGALNHAGYDADAWTSDRNQQQEQQQQRQQQQQRRTNRRSDEFYRESVDLGIAGIDGPYQQ